MKLISEALGLLFGVAVVVWIVSIYVAIPEQKAVAMCRPVHYAVNGAGYAIFAVTGAQTNQEAAPAWQDQARLWCLKVADRGVEAARK